MITGRNRTRSSEAAGDPLPRSFFDRPVLDVAPELLGRELLRRTPEGPVRLRITEVEAYAGESDPGSHAYRGPTKRNAAMFGPPGHAYVYFIYGMWWSLNLVCGPEGRASGVLLRGGEVLTGQKQARERRPKARKDTELAKGPARLATALAVNGELNFADVCSGDGTAPLTVLAGTPLPPDTVATSPRTGVGGAGAQRPWRFYAEGDPTVSPYRPHQPRRRNKPLDAGQPEA